MIPSSDLRVPVEGGEWANWTALMITSDPPDPLGIADINGLYGPGSWTGWQLTAFASLIRSLSSRIDDRFIDLNTWLFILVTNCAAIDLLRQLPRIEGPNATAKAIGTIGASLNVTVYGHVILNYHIFIAIAIRMMSRHQHGSSVVVAADSVENGGSSTPEHETLVDAQESSPAANVSLEGDEPLPLTPAEDMSIGARPISKPRIDPIKATEGAAATTMRALLTRLMVLFLGGFVPGVVQTMVYMRLEEDHDRGNRYVLGEVMLKDIPFSYSYGPRDTFQALGGLAMLTNLCSVAYYIAFAALLIYLALDLLQRSLTLPEWLSLKNIRKILRLNAKGLLVVLPTCLVSWALTRRTWLFWILAAYALPVISFLVSLALVCMPVAAMLVVPLSLQIFLPLVFTGLVLTNLLDWTGKTFTRSCVVIPCTSKSIAEPDQTYGLIAGILLSLSIDVVPTVLLLIRIWGKSEAEDRRKNAFLQLSRMPAPGQLERTDSMDGMDLLHDTPLPLNNSQPVDAARDCFSPRDLYENQAAIDKVRPSETQQTSDIEAQTTEDEEVARAYEDGYRHRLQQLIETRPQRH